MTSAPQPRGAELGPTETRGSDHTDHCITCGDVAEPLTVVNVDHERVLALCQNEAGGRETVEIALVGRVDEGDELLVHAGTAIAHLGVSA